MTMCALCGEPIRKGHVDYSDTPGWVHVASDEAKCDDGEDSPDAEPDLAAARERLRAAAVAATDARIACRAVEDAYYAAVNELETLLDERDKERKR
jgi:hypothetical protein